MITYLKNEISAGGKKINLEIYEGEYKNCGFSPDKYISSCFMHEYNSGCYLWSIQRCGIFEIIKCNVSDITFDQQILFSLQRSSLGYSPKLGLDTISKKLSHYLANSKYDYLLYRASSRSLMYKIIDSKISKKDFILESEKMSDVNCELFGEIANVSGESGCDYGYNYSAKLITFHDPSDLSDEEIMALDPRDRPH